MTITLKLSCPLCSRRVRRVDEAQTEATTIIRRSCKCGVRFQVKVAPKKVTGGWAHFLDWTVLEEMADAPEGSRPDC